MDLQKVAKTNRIQKFLLLLFVFAIYVFFSYFDNRINGQNTTALALSYEYGFVPRGLIGTIMRLVGNVISVDLLTYNGAFWFSVGATIVYFMVLFFLYWTCLRKVKSDDHSLVEMLILFASIFMFPEFLTSQNFGRLDEYLMIVTLLGIILLVIEKAEILLIPLCAIGTLIHAGFVFTNVAIILILLIWKAFEREGKERKKYIFLFASCFVTVSIFFLYFEIFQGPFSQASYEEIVMLAKSMAYDGKDISHSLLDSEILKLDVFEDEWKWHVCNFVETPIFLLFMSPIISIMVKFVRGLWNKCETVIEKMKYLLLLIGVGTLLPSLILKIDYGRWFYCIFAYYVLLAIALVVLKDKKFIMQCKEIGALINSKVVYKWGLLVYLMLFMPFRDVRISDISTNITEFLAATFGWW